MRVFLPLFYLLLVAGPAFASADLNGSWSGMICPQPGVGDASRCASFTLRLYQKQDRICGTHLFATAGARQMDEGGMPSIMAKASGDAINGTVESQRVSPAIRIPVTLSLAGTELRWQRTENPPGDYLLPHSMILTRSRQGGILSPLSEQRLSAACSTFLDLPPENAKAPAPTPR
ncbi:MAG: hypothetical protein JWP36_747 [Paucimonas sp.]|jgi:hypothetical protein|nr:hypothetical protein [Paucimonas sp.]